MVLTVVDVYPSWAGPCNAMLTLLKKAKNALLDDSDKLQLVAARTDSIDQLEMFRGNCQPVWLFFASGQTHLIA